MEACAISTPDLDDRSFALRLQLEEMCAVRDIQAGKWVEDNPPDFVLAFTSFENEIRRAMVVAKDAKFAQSIDAALESDAMVIDEVNLEESQCVQDRQLAVSLDGGVSLPPQYFAQAESMFTVGVDPAQRDYAVAASPASIDSSSIVAGPSFQYVDHEMAPFESVKVYCTVCTEPAQSDATVKLLCGDIYCKPCLKSFLLRVIKDESLFPPKCHHKSIDKSTIESVLSSEELQTYRNAELEYTSADRVYCANLDCASFILPHYRNFDYAFCMACNSKTCLNCKDLAHQGTCAVDEVRESLIACAEEQGWKACFGCGEMVSRDEGCDHMTCRCRAEFCYRCGVKWKDCQCGDWVPELLNRRAQQIVDREAPGLLPSIRQRRVADMAQELQATHECDHSGKFTKIEGSRRGKVCEVCGTRHRKYILSCKRCHMLACEDCRRYRI